MEKLIVCRHRWPEAFVEDGSLVRIVRAGDVACRIVAELMAKRGQPANEQEGEAADDNGEQAPADDDTPGHGYSIATERGRDGSIGAAVPVTQAKG